MRILTSHLLEDLLDALVAQLQDAPLPPLSTETIVVPGLGLARWLELRLAERLGIAAGIELPLLGSFLHRLTDGAADGAAAAFTRDALTWRLWRVLTEHGSRNTSPFDAASDYVRDDKDGRKRLQLCTRLAAAFDDYQLYRDDLLLSFAAGNEHRALSPHAPWQAKLWRALLEDQGLRAPEQPGDGPRDATPLLFAEPAGAGPRAPSWDHAHRLQQLRRSLEDADWRDARLPERLTVFGTTTMPPAFLRVLQRIACFVPVHLYVPQPTPHYYGHLRERRSHAGDNALLARFGTESREFAELLLDLEDADGDAAPIERHALDEDALDDDATPRSLLACLQQDIARTFDRSDRKAEKFALRTDDASLRVHDCHSPQRELEVVRDQIFQAFDEDPTLRPSDVLVLVPDIDRYAPYAHAVFDPVQTHLPFHVADRSPGRELPVCRALLAVLGLAGQRLALGDVLHLLETTAVQRRFGLFPSDLPPLRHVCHRAGIRWGLDGASRHEQFDVPPFDDNSWRQGLDRLLLGTLTGPCDELVSEHAPVGDTTDGRSERLARFVTFVETLFEQVAELRRAQPLTAWADRIDALLAAMFADDHTDRDEAWATLQRATVALRTQAEVARHTQPVSLAVVADWLERTLAAGVSARGFLGGAVTVAAMLPMRAVPVRCLFVCGLDDESFPRRDQAPPFDLIAAKARPGDRSRRLDDRQLFLDLLQSARERLHLCFVGRSAKDNAEAAPSVVLSELLDHVDRTCSTRDSRPPRALVTVMHPLQPWSPRYGAAGDRRLFTFARRPAPERVARGDDEPWCPDGVDVLPSRELHRLELDDLLTFWWNPCRAFLREGLRVRVRAEDEQEEDHEPFALDSLARYGLQDAAVRRAQRGEPEHEDPLRIARAEGVLPVGAHGDAVFHTLRGETEELLQAARRYAGSRSRRIDLDLDGVQLVGAFDGFADEELVCMRVGKLKPKDRLQAWIKHLLVTLQREHDGAQADPAWPDRTRVLASDGAWIYPKLPATDAREHLTDLLELYRAGLRRPLPFFERSSFTIGSKVAKGKAPADGLRTALRDYRITEADKPWLSDLGDAAIALCMRGRDPFEAGEQGECCQLAQRIWLPAIGALQEAN